MARSTYLGTANDVLFARTGPVLKVPTKTVTLTFWDAETGGTQHTDLIVDGQPATEVVVAADAGGATPAVQGPDGVDGGMWVQAQLAGETAADAREFVTPSRPLEEAKAHADATVAGLVIPATAADVGADPAGTAQGLVDGLVAAAPGTLDTLNELAAALGDDPDFAGTVLGELANKVDGIDLDTLVGTEIQTPGSETQAGLLAVDADETSALRVQQDARHSATYAPVDLTYAGQQAVAETGRIVRTDDDMRADLTPDGRTEVVLLTGGTDQTYSISSCTAANDPTRHKHGTQSKRFTTTGAVTASAIVDPVFPTGPDPITWNGGSIVRFWVWVDDPSVITSVSLEIRTNSALSDIWTRTQASSAPSTLKRGWNLLSWKASAGVITTWGAAYRVRVLVVTTAATSFNIGKAWIECPLKAQLLFINDGGYKTFYDVGLPGLRARGIPVTWASSFEQIGAFPGLAAERITQAQYDAVYAAGDDISFHSAGGQVHSTMTAAEVRDNALRALAWLQSSGYERGRQWRAAWTQNNAPEHAAAKPYLAAYATPSGLASGETFPFLNKWNIGRVPIHGRTNADFDNQFSILEKTRELLVCYTHGINAAGGADATPTEWAYFLSKIDAGLSGGWLEGVTMSQLIERGGGILRP